MSKNTGARGLRSILENILMNAMYEVCDFFLFDIKLEPYKLLPVWINWVADDTYASRSIFTSTSHVLFPPWMVQNLLIAACEATKMDEILQFP